MKLKLTSSRKSFLLRHLAKHAYDGNIQLPRTGVNILENFDICEGRYKCKRLEKHKHLQSKVREFVVELFKERKMSDYLEDELNLWCDTGVSFAICDDDKITGVILSLFIEKESDTPDYVSAKEWLNQAADLATSQTRHNPAHVWRNAQFLHLQHFNQQIISKHGAKFGLHAGAGCLSE